MVPTCITLGNRVPSQASRKVFCFANGVLGEQTYTANEVTGSKEAALPGSTSADRKKLPSPPPFHSGGSFYLPPLTKNKQSLQRLGA